MTIQSRTYLAFLCSPEPLFSSEEIDGFLYWSLLENDVYAPEAKAGEMERHAVASEGDGVVSLAGWLRADMVPGNYPLCWDEVG